MPNLFFFCQLCGCLVALKRIGKNSRMIHTPPGTIFGRNPGPFSSTNIPQNLIRIHAGSKKIAPPASGIPETPADFLEVIVDG